MEETDIDELVRSAERLIQGARGPLKSVRVRSGDRSVELDWAEASVETARTVTTSTDHGTHHVVVTVDETSRPVGSYVVQAPLVGTFYRSPDPDSPPFVSAGDSIGAGQQVAIVEAMKLMNAVAAERPGVVLEVLVEDGTPVEYGDDLFVIVPA